MRSRSVPVRLLLLPMIALAAVAHSDLPEGKGKDTVENTCTDCHSLERIKAQHMNEEGWNGTVREMIENGASINPDDIRIIVNYLTKNFGPDTGKKININKATASEMAAALQLASAEANAIVQYRTRNGPFKDLSELEKASGVADKIEAKKALIEF